MAKQQASEAPEADPQMIERPASLVVRADEESDFDLLLRAGAAVTTADRAVLERIAAEVVNLFRVGVPHQTAMQAQIAARLHVLVFGPEV